MPPKSGPKDINMDQATFKLLVEFGLNGGANPGVFASMAEESGMSVKTLRMRWHRLVGRYKALGLEGSITSSGKGTKEAEDEEDDVKEVKGAKGCKRKGDAEEAKPAKKTKAVKAEPVEDEDNEA